MDRLEYCHVLERVIPNYQECLLSLSKETTIYQKISNRLNEKHGLKDLEPDLMELIEKALEFLDVFQKKFRNIQVKINRNKIIISMFGRVSVGKSKLLNALFGMDLFVSMAAHSTSCFVNISQSKDYHHTIQYGMNPSENVRNLDELKELLKNLGSTMGSTTESMMASTMASTRVGGHLATRETLMVRLGRAGVDQPPRLLQGGITKVVDTPGSGNKDETGQLLQRMSEDSDIFIFVVGNTLSDADKLFFDYQNDHSSRPDVFLLVNAWDQSDGDSERATRKSRESIKREGEKFIKANLERDSSKSPSDRIAFISAREMLKIKLGELVPEKLTRKQIERKEDFEKFEAKLEEYVRDPEKNKARRHGQQLAEMTEQLFDQIGIVLSDCARKQDKTLGRRYVKMNQNVIETLSRIKQNFAQMKADLLKNISDKFKDFEKYYIIQDTQTLRTQIKGYVDDLQIRMQKIQADNEELIREFKTKFQETLGKHITQKVQKPTLGDIFNKPLEFQIAETSKTRKTVTGVITTCGYLAQFAPNPIFKIFGAVLTCGTKLVNNYMDDNDEKEIREKNIIKIQQLRNSLQSEVPQALDKMLEFVEKKLSSMEDTISQKHRIYRNYWEEVDNLISDMETLTDECILD